MSALDGSRRRATGTRAGASAMPSWPGALEAWGPGRVAAARRAKPFLLGIAALVGMSGLAAALAGAPPRAAPRPTDSCVGCHGGLDEARLAEPARRFATDIHAERGLGCVSCHGGDAADADITAMDPDKGFRGKPSRREVADLCASCHASAAFMKRYNPRPYIFSVEEFRTSVHCKREELGDHKVATCTNCHGAHGIRSHRDPVSPVYPRNVPATCGRCHNADYMKGRTVRTDQLALYSKSVHGVALLEKNDVSAPACNDCHGNHGAAPPGIKDLTLVCGSCHGREAELFNQSRMKTAMESRGLRGCVTCHSNHDVRHPTDALLSTGAGGLCGSCHLPGSTGDRGARAIEGRFHALRDSLDTADSLLKLAELRGMEAEAGREALREAQDRLVATRATVHSFDEARVTAVLAEGSAYARRAAESGAAALRDWRMRRLGMGLSLVVIVTIILLLIVRIRRLEGG